jgi:hypothetical protein
MNSAGSPQPLRGGGSAGGEGEDGQGGAGRGGHDEQPAAVELTGRAGLGSRVSRSARTSDSTRSPARIVISPMST